MNILYPTGLVTQFFGRNPIYGAIIYNGTNIAPHGSTQRATYTVPANRAAVITSIYLKVMRQTAAGTVGLVQAQGLVDFAAGIAGLENAMFINNNPGANDLSIDPGYKFTVAARTIAIYTLDTSLGGTCTYNALISYVEFDP